MTERIDVSLGGGAAMRPSRDYPRATLAGGRSVSRPCGSLQTHVRATPETSYGVGERVQSTEAVELPILEGSIPPIVPSRCTMGRVPRPGDPSAFRTARYLHATMRGASIPPRDARSGGTAMSYTETGHDLYTRPMRIAHPRPSSDVPRGRGPGPAP